MTPLCWVFADSFHCLKCREWIQDPGPGARPHLCSSSLSMLPCLWTAADLWVYLWVLCCIEIFSHLCLTVPGAMTPIWSENRNCGTLDSVFLVRTLCGEHFLLVVHLLSVYGVFFRFIQLLYFGLFLGTSLNLVMALFLWFLAPSPISANLLLLCKNATDLSWFSSLMFCWNCL